MKGFFLIIFFNVRLGIIISYLWLFPFKILTLSFNAIYSGILFFVVLTFRVTISWKF